MSSDLPCKDSRSSCKGSPSDSLEVLFLLTKQSIRSMKDFLGLCQERFSARKFTVEPVSQQDLDYMKECVRLAPSATNSQPWKFLIITSDTAKQQLQECYNREWFKSAPLYIRRTHLNAGLGRKTANSMATSTLPLPPNICVWRLPTVG